MEFSKLLVIGALLMLGGNPTNHNLKAQDLPYVQNPPNTNAYQTAVSITISLIDKNLLVFALSDGLMTEANVTTYVLGQNIPCLLTGSTAPSGQYSFQLTVGTLMNAGDTITTAKSFSSALVTSNGDQDFSDVTSQYLSDTSVHQKEFDLDSSSQESGLVSFLPDNGTPNFNMQCNLVIDTSATDLSSDSVGINLGNQVPEPSSIFFLAASSALTAVLLMTRFRCRAEG